MKFYPEKEGLALTGPLKHEFLMCCFFTLLSLHMLLLTELGVWGCFLFFLILSKFLALVMKHGQQLCWLPVYCLGTLWN